LASCFSVAGGNGAEVLEFAEEPLDEIAVAIEEPAEGGNALAPRHRLDIGPGAACGQDEQVRSRQNMPLST